MNTSKIPIRFLAALLIALASAPPLAAQETEKKNALSLEALEAHIEERIDRGLHRAMVIGIVTADDVEYIAKGTFREGDPRKVSARTMFELGSVTEIFTSMLFAQFVAEGKMSPPDFVNKYLPKGVKTPELEGEKITLEHLLLHTSGLPSMPDNLVTDNRLIPYRDYTEEQLYLFLGLYELESPPGTAYVYSSLGMGLLSHVMERHTGSTYMELVKNRILDPLDMNSTSMELSQIQLYHLARGHLGDDQVDPWEMDLLAGGGALRSNAHDMTKFLQAHLGLFENRIAPSIEATHKPRGEVAGKARSTWGWYAVIDEEAGIDLFFRNSQTAGHVSFLGIDKNRQIGVVILSNTAQPVDAIGLHILNPGAFGLPKYVERIEEDKEIQQQYLGAFEFPNGRRILFTRKLGKIYARTQMQGNYQIWATAPDTYYHPKMNARITFLRNDNGAVDRVTIAQGDQEVTAVRFRTE